MKTNGIKHKANIGYYMSTFIYDFDLQWGHEFYIKRPHCCKYTIGVLSIRIGTPSHCCIEINHSEALSLFCFVGRALIQAPA